MLSLSPLLRDVGQINSLSEMVREGWGGMNTYKHACDAEFAVQNHWPEAIGPSISLFAVKPM
jgi:hypothetical protein